MLWLLPLAFLELRLSLRTISFPFPAFSSLILWSIPHKLYFVLARFHSDQYTTSSLVWKWPVLGSLLKGQLLAVPPILSLHSTVQDFVEVKLKFMCSVTLTLFYATLACSPYHFSHLVLFCTRVQLNLFLLLCLASSCQVRVQHHVCVTALTAVHSPFAQVESLLLLFLPLA